MRPTCPSTLFYGNFESNTDLFSLLALILQGSKVAWTGIGKYASTAVRRIPQSLGNPFWPPRLLIRQKGIADAKTIQGWAGQRRDTG